MKKTLLASAACAALAASTSYGAVTASVLNMGVPDAGDGPLVGYTAYLVSLNSTGGKITGVDLSDAGAAGKDFEFAQKIIHQVWFKNKKITLTSEVGPTPTAADSLDSFFIAPLDDEANWALGAGPSEDNDAGGPGVGTSPLAGNNPSTATSSVGDLYGGGNFMRIAYGVVPAGQSTAMDIAYLVLRDDRPNLLATAMIAVAGEGEYSVPIVVPEPGTATLFGLSLLGLARRRRA